MLFFAAVDAHKGLALVDFSLQLRHHAFQFPTAFSQQIAILLYLLRTVLVMLLGQFESLLEFV